MELGAPNLKPVFKHSFLDAFLHLAPFTFPTPRLVLTFLVSFSFCRKTASSVSSCVCSEEGAEVSFIVEVEHRAHLSFDSYFQS